jgi:hypothetical protein
MQADQKSQLVKHVGVGTLTISRPLSSHEKKLAQHFWKLQMYVSTATTDLVYRVIAAVRVAALRRNTPAVRLRLGFGRVHT